jgi:hypothetical protein
MYMYVVVVVVASCTSGLDRKIVSGSMEFSLREAYSDNVDRGNGDIELQKFILSIDPMHYFRRGKPFTTTLPGTPSSWMEQWPIGDRYMATCIYLAKVLI